MMDWQKIVREATREAASAKWRDYALTRLPEVTGFTLSKPKGFGAGTEAVYTGQTRAGIPLKVTVDKSKGVWRAEASGLFVEDDIVGLDAGAVQHALGEAAEALDQHIQNARRRRKTGARPAQAPREVADANLAGEMGADELRDHIRRAAAELADHEVGRAGDDIGALRAILVGLLDRLEEGGATYHLPFSPVHPAAPTR